jgi:hypothetical protein
MGVTCSVTERERTQSGMSQNSASAGIFVPKGQGDGENRRAKSFTICAVHKT